MLVDVPDVARVQELAMPRHEALPEGALERRLASQFPELTDGEVAQHAGHPAGWARPSMSDAGEQAALDRLAERLAQQFPELPAEDIVATINGHYSDDHSTIRDFAPVLEERPVPADIQVPSTSQHRHRA